MFSWERNQIPHLVDSVRITALLLIGKLDIAGPAAPFAPTHVGWRGVFRTWNLIKAISSVVSSEGRAPDHYSGCHRFDSCTTRQVVNLRDERCVENTTTMKA